MNKKLTPQPQLCIEDFYMLNYLYNYDIFYVSEIVELSE